MELKCPECGEKAVHRTPNNVTVQMPQDRTRYAHTDGSALCPVVGITHQGTSGYVPALPVDKKL